jgi:phage baseplate assembly protein gpV
VATLKWQEELTTFSARVSGVGQVSDVTVNSHDPKAGQATSGSASSPQAVGSAPIWSKRSSAAQALGGGTALVADRVATSTSEAKSMATAALARNLSAFVEADGVAKGSPKLRAGATVRIAGIDSDFCGDYVLSATTHIYRGGGAYTTKFEITGDRSRTFAQLAGGSGGSSPTGGAVAGGGGGDAKSSWAQQLVIAIVDNNNDPDKLGRVKVKYPALGDNMVSDWARVATNNAGKGRGLFMLPQVGDEVVVGFEHGDPRRPFVLGSLYTGTKAPLDADLMDGDGQKSKFAVKTDHQVLLHSQKEMKLHTEEKLTVEVKGNPGDMTIKADGNVKTEASKNFEAKATSAVKVEGTSSVELKSSGQVKVEGSTVSISGSGMVEVKGSMIKLG